MDSIEKLRLKNNEVLTQLIQTHLSFCIDSNFDFNQIQRKHNKRKIIDNNSTIFGSNLTQEGICCVNQLIEFITRDNNIVKEGIFRKSGSSLRQIELRNLISSGITVDLSANRFTVHDCCSVLKKFVSELPEPLLTESHFELLDKVSELSSSEVFSPNRAIPNSKKLTSIQLFLLLIPAPNRQLLKELLSLFEKVLQNGESNKMSSLSLATIFVPPLLLPRNWSPIEIQRNLYSITETLIFMIDNSKLLFEAPVHLIRDVNRQLEIIEMSTSKTTSQSSLGALNSVQFCVPETNANSDDFTANQVAQLYAYIQAMPNSGTPMKKKWIKRFNRENGNGTPLLKDKKLDSTKKFKSSIGDVLKSSKEFLFGSSDETTKQNKINKTLFKDSSLNSGLNEKQLYSKFTPKSFENKSKTSGECSEETDEQSVTPLSLSLGNANKKVRLSVRKVGNRDPIVM